MEGNAVKQYKIKDMDFEDIKILIDETLNSIIIIGHNIAVDKNAYEEQKHHYEIRFLKLKYSEEYAEYKTVKEKEERVTIELDKEKEHLIKFKRQIDQYKAQLEHKQLLLKYLFRLYDEKVVLE